MSLKTTLADCRRTAAGEARKLRFGFLGGGGFVKFSAGGYTN
ncbi:hypothetical protein ACS0X5_35125 [Burkholderia gladioli]